MNQVNLSRLLEESVRKCKKLYILKDKEEDRDIILNIESNIKVSCDEYYIRRSFENLIINAIQYCRKGKIILTLARDKDDKKSNIIFSIKDEGIGIPEDDLGKIFEPFEVSSKTLTPAGGRGMGLTLVKRVIELHKGNVKVESNGKKGSSFTVILPT
jgi:signal transduction histidine kinase